MREGQLDARRRARHALQVRAGVAQATVVAAQSLEHAVAAHQAVVQRHQRYGALRHEFPIDHHGDVTHGDDRIDGVAAHLTRVASGGAVQPRRPARR